MRAAYLNAHGGEEVIEIGEVPTPEPGPGEVRVKVKIAALNHLDVWVRKGMPGLKLKYPHVLGGDAAGVVDKIGAGVLRVKQGESVIVHPGLSCRACEFCLGGWESLCAEYKILGEHVSGTHAEYVVVPEANVFHQPSNITFEEAAAIPLVYTTAWQMLVRRAQIQPGEKVVVHAAGSGVGSAAIQIAKLFGAEIIATAGSRAKLELARELGAQHTINYAEGDWVKALRELAPRGADVIFDHLGQDYWEQNIRATRSGGRIVVCGATTGHEAKTDLRHVFYRQIQILGSTMGSKGDFQTILRHVARGTLKGVVDRSFPLKDARQAHQRIERRESVGKVLLVP